MEKVKKVLVLGSSGMLGHILLRTIKNNELFQVYNIARNKTIHSDTIICDVTDFGKLENKIQEISPDYIINCIGILIKQSSLNIANAILINSYLPHFLDSVSKKYKFHLIHISTDCVFNGKKGAYNEESIKDARDTYGITKGLGEIISPKHLTIRTSIIGPEIKVIKEGLLEWVLNNKGKEIDGYTKSIWSGITTLVLSRAITYCIENDIRGLLHISNHKISKYDLICLVNDIYNLQINVNKVEGKKLDKSLVSVRKDFLFKVPSYPDMITEMYEYMNQN